MTTIILILLAHHMSLAHASLSSSLSSASWDARRTRLDERYNQRSFYSYTRKTSIPSCENADILNPISRCTNALSHQRRHGVCFLSNVFGNTRSFTTPSLLCRDPISNNYFALSVSKSKFNRADGEAKQHDNPIKKSGSRTKKNKKICDDVGGTKRRMKQSEINDLVRGIGLEPVVQSVPSSKKEQRATLIINNETHNSKQMQEDRDQHRQHMIDHILTTRQVSPSISLQTQLDYSQYGHAPLRSFLPQTIIQQLRSELLPYAASHALSAWRQKVELQLADSSDEYYRDNARTITSGLKSIEECQDLLEGLGMDPLADLPFLQHFNTWRAAAHSNTPTVRKLCLSPYLARTASILLNAPTIRLYQDSLFHKRVGDGWTPWHSDARMAPFDTSKMITFWIPLQKVPEQEDGGTGLLFVDGSHSDFALPYWNGAVGEEYDRLEDRYGDGGGVSQHMPLELGDVTVHNGWTLHCADAAEFDDAENCEDRYAFSVSFVDGCAEVREDVLSFDATNEAAAPKGDKEDVWSFRSWVEEVEPRTEFRHPLVPVVWPSVQIDVE